MGPCSSKSKEISEKFSINEKPKQVVLLGNLGSGKTSLFNKICSKQEKVKYGGASVTKHLAISTSCKGMGFRVVDTPGFGAVNDRLAHSIGILAGLTEGPIIRILIVVKYDRIDIMIESVSKICKIVYKYMDLVTLIISHWDLCKEEDQTSEKEIMQEQFKTTFKITSIIFSHIKITSEEICQQIDQAITSKSQQLEIRETEFDVFFDNLDLNFDLDCCKDQFSRNFNGFADTVKEFIHNLQQNLPDLDEILHSLTVYIKEEAERMVSEFEMQAGKTMNDIYAKTDSVVLAYLTHIELKKSIMGTVQQLVESCQRKMILSPNHPFNLLKKCNHCGEVWMKVQGCSGPTVCGEIPNIDEIMQGRSHTKYRFVYKDKQISYTLLQSTKAQMIFKNKQGNKVGCLKAISWSTMIPIDPKIMEEVMKDKIFDFLCNKQMENTVSKKWALNKQKMIEEAIKAIRIV